MYVTTSVHLKNSSYLRSPEQNDEIVFLDTLCPSSTFQSENEDRLFVVQLDEVRDTCRLDLTIILLRKVGLLQSL